MKNIVYKITNLITGQIYFGITRRTLKTRWMQHCCFSLPNTRMRKSIKKHGKNNFKIETLKYFRTNKEALAEERRLIKKYKTNFCRHPDGNGLNTCDGGQAGNTGYIATEDHRRRLSKALKGKKKSASHAKNIREAKLGEKNPMYGRPQSRKSRDAARKRWLGKDNPMKGKFGAANPLYGRKRPPDVVAKITAANMRTARAVGLVGHNGKIIKKFSSTGAACKFIGVKNGVHAVCLGKQKTAGGYRWRFI